MGDYILYIQFGFCLSYDERIFYMTGLKIDPVDQILSIFLGGVEDIYHV